MFDGMDVDGVMELPGGSSFEDVTGLFEQAAREIKPEEVLLTPGFTLMDSMSAFEIGEPRMDSGMLLEQDERPPFDPLAPLLPEELCWILDRSFACEMGWYAGNTLSQTVYTLLYVHALQDINPDLLPPSYFYASDPARPLQLITLILRPAVFALLKSCDLVWRELSKKRVHDMEDWQSEKCEVPLLEGVPVDMVLRRLDEACAWLHSATLPSLWADALGDRLMLRKTLLQLYNCSHIGNLDEIKPLVTIARNLLRRVRTRPSPPPSTDSPALAAFDPRVTRRLHTVMPTRELELPAQDVIWDDIERVLHGWEDVDHLRESHTLTAWQVNGSLGVWIPSNPLPLPYIRSLTQRVFSDNRLVLGEYPEGWIVEQFFWETLGISYESICEVLVNTWAGPGALMLQQFEAHVVEIVAGNLKSYWFNPPRRRRFLMKSVADWILLEDAFLNLATHVVVSSPHAVHTISALPLSAETWKLSVAREIILSGFQQELYTAYERPLAYWCLAKLLEEHLEVLDRLRVLTPDDSYARSERDFQSQYLLALQMMCIALLSLTSDEEQPSPERMSLNFNRRYKWLLDPTEDYPENLIFPFLSLDDFIADLEDVRQSDSSASEHLKVAQDALAHLPEFIPQADEPTKEADGRAELIRHLVRVNEQLSDFVDGPRNDAKLRWDPKLHPWFPTVVP